MGLTVRLTLDNFRSSIWAIPALCVGLAVLVAVLVLEIDARIDPRLEAFFLFGGGPDSARAVLSTIAGALITVIAFTFSVTMLVLQLSSQQLSPRVMRVFLRDDFNKWVMGVLTGTMTYSFLLLANVRDMNDDSNPGFVPALGVFLAIAAAVGCIALFFYYLDHMANAIRASRVIGQVGHETAGVIRHGLYPRAGDERPDFDIASLGAPNRTVSHAGGSGVVTGVDDGALLELVTKAGAVLRLHPMVGDYVVSGSPLADVWERPGHPVEDAAVRGAVAFGRERTMQQDVLFGFRQLADIVARALSPGVNDPTTAVQALDECHMLLRLLALHPIPAACRADEDGTVRLILPRPDWDGYVHLVVDEARQYGSDSVQVMRRLGALLADLAVYGPPACQPVVREQMQLLRKAVERSFPDHADRVFALATEQPDDTPA